MRVAVALEPDMAAAARLLAGWRAAWSAPADGEEVELAPVQALAALLDLKARCYDQGVTVTATFPDNQ